MLQDTVQCTVHCTLVNNCKILQKYYKSWACSISIAMLGYSNKMKIYKYIIMEFWGQGVILRITQGPGKGFKYFLTIG